MKKILTTALILYATLAVNAQQEGFHKISIGAEGALPIGDFGEGNNIGFGASGKVHYGITQQADITGMVGYLHFGMKNDTEYISARTGILPVLFGYRHRFDTFYVEPQVGFAHVLSKVTVKDDLGMGLSEWGGSASATKFSAAAGGGLEFGSWDLGARFQLIDNLNFLSIRLAYSLSL